MIFLKEVSKEISTAFFVEHPECRQIQQQESTEFLFFKVSNMRLKTDAYNRSIAFTEGAIRKTPPIASFVEHLESRPV